MNRPLIMRLSLGTMWPDSSAVSIQYVAPLQLTHSKLNSCLWRVCCGPTDTSELFLITHSTSMLTHSQWVELRVRAGHYRDALSFLKLRKNVAFNGQVFLDSTGSDQSVPIRWFAPVLMDDWSGTWRGPSPVVAHPPEGSRCCAFWAAILRL